MLLNNYIFKLKAGPHGPPERVFCLQILDFLACRHALVGFLCSDFWFLGLLACLWVLGLWQICPVANFCLRPVGRLSSGPRALGPCPLVPGPLSTGPRDLRPRPCSHGPRPWAHMEPVGADFRPIWCPRVLHTMWSLLRAIPPQKGVRRPKDPYGHMGPMGLHWPLGPLGPRPPTPCHKKKAHRLLYRLTAPRLYKLTTPRLYKVTAPTLYKLTTPRLYKLTTSRLCKLTAPRIYKLTAPILYKLTAPILYKLTAPILYKLTRQY